MLYETEIKQLQDFWSETEPFKSSNLPRTYFDLGMGQGMLAWLHASKEPGSMFGLPIQYKNSAIIALLLFLFDYFKLKAKYHIRTKINSKKSFIWDISIITILTCRKLGLVGPIQQKIKLPLTDHINGTPKREFVKSRPSDFLLYVPSL